VSDAADLIAGGALKASAQRFLAEVRARVDHEQSGLLSIFDSWFSRVLTKLSRLDRERPWEESVNAHAAGSSGPAPDLQWDLNRLRLFLDRWEQGRFVEFSRRERSAVHYHSRFGTEFGADVLLTCQGAPSLMRWRGKPLMKNVFDFAIYPALIAELRLRTIFEIGSGSGASAAWFADLLTLNGTDGRVHSVDIAQVQMQHPRVHFHQGDCSDPDSLFPGDLLQTARHPWLVVEDAHHNVAGVLDWLHRFLVPGDYLVVEDSDWQSRLLCRGSGWDDQPFVRGRRQSAPVRARSHAARNCEHSLGRFRRTHQGRLRIGKGPAGCRQFRRRTPDRSGADGAARP
jgi:hypothetical protein